MKKQMFFFQRESNDPLTEIRFVCDQPFQMHRKKSDQLSSDDFVCSNNNPAYTEGWLNPCVINILTFIQNVQHELTAIIFEAHALRLQ